jgi:methyl-accepting chemotaxis protein
VADSRKNRKFGFSTACFVFLFIFSFMQEFIIGFVPENLRQNPDEFRRARLLTTTSFTTTFIAGFYAVQYFFVWRNFTGGTLLLAAAALCAVVPFLLRGGGNINVLSHALVASFWITSAGLCLTEGGHDSPARPWVAIVPLLAVLFTGRSGGARWLVASLAALSGFYGLKLAGVELPKMEISAEQMALQNYFGIAGIAILLFVLGRIYEQSKSTTLEQLEITRRESEERAKTDYEELERLKRASEERARQDLATIERQEQYLADNVSTALQAVDMMAQGDLTAQLRAENDDDIGLLFQAINSAINNMSEMIARVILSANATADAVASINATANSLAADAREQTGQVVQLAGAVEEMSRTIGENTEQISVAAYEASLANDEAYQSEKVMRSMIDNVQKVGKVVLDSADKMTQLGASSEKIGEIVSVIDEIADQTNLLALNAAIEAARAGESGRGFAVVADEVRKLAERTQKATKEISVMIKTIQNEMSAAVQGMNTGADLVQEGGTLVNRTTEALEQIIARTSKVSGVMSQVAAASDQQSATGELMAKSMASMSSIIERSAASANDIAQSVERLMRQTDELRATIQQFVLANESQRRLTPNERPQLGAARGAFS